MSNNSVNFISTAFSHYLVQVVLKTLLQRQLPNERALGFADFYTAKFTTAARIHMRNML